MHSSLSSFGAISRLVRGVQVAQEAPGRPTSRPMGHMDQQMHHR